MSQQRLRELVLYVAKTCENDPDFGMVKLNKVLFHADFSQYLRTGRSISGEQHQKEEQGPVVTTMVPMLAYAEADRDLDIEKMPKGEYEQKRVRPRRDPDVDLFHDWELAAIDESIEFLRGMSASEISEYFHKYRGWQAANIGEPIPYSSAYFIQEAPTQDELEYGLQLVGRKVV